MDLLPAVLLGILEGLTEFIPVSSTGHLLLATHFFRLEVPATFAVFIQLGPILALAWMYRAKLVRVFSTAHRDVASRRFIISVALAFLPAMAIGALAHDVIKAVLFETPWLIAAMLVLGGVVLLFVDRMPVTETVTEADNVPWPKALALGFVQCLAMVPGVSRSGATIVGARALGFSKRAAAEFSFFLSLPTMMGAASYDLLKTWDQLDFSALAALVVGFLAAMVAGGLVVKWLLGYVSTKGYALFGWWRIILGLGAMALLSMGF